MIGDYTPDPDNFPQLLIACLLLINHTLLSLYIPAYLTAVLYKADGMYRTLCTVSSNTSCYHMERSSSTSFSLWCIYHGPIWPTMHLVSWLLPRSTLLCMLCSSL